MCNEIVRFGDIPVLGHALVEDEAHAVGSHRQVGRCVEDTSSSKFPEINQIIKQ